MKENPKLANEIEEKIRSYYKDNELELEEEVVKVENPVDEVEAVAEKTETLKE